MLSKILGSMIPVVLIIAFCAPLIPIGIENLSMMRYFNQDESLLVEYGIRFYQAGVLPTEKTIAYPKFFNFICGIVLYPYTFFVGADATVVALVFRWLNTLALAMTCVLMYLIGKNIFQSYWVGILSATLYALTPENIYWGVNSRPHPVEILFIVWAIYDCLMAVEKQSQKLIWRSVVWAGLATGTKMGGLLLIPTISLAYGYITWQKKLNKEDLKPEKTLVSAFSFFSIGAGLVLCALVCYGILFRVRATTGQTVYDAVGFFGGLLTSPYVYGALGGVSAISVGIAGILFTKIVSQIYQETLPDIAMLRNTKVFFVLFFNRMLTFIIKVTLVTLGIYLITNIDFLIFPVQNITETIRMTMWTLLSVSLERDTNYLAWLTYIPTAACMGVGGTIMVVYYFCADISTLKSNQFVVSDRKLIKRLILFSYPAFLIVFLCFGVQHRPAHYLLPAFVALFLLGVDALIRIVVKQKNPRRKGFYILVSAVLILGCVIERLPKLDQYYIGLSSRASDPAITEFVPRLVSTYSDTTHIMLSGQNIYIPEIFENQTYWRPGCNFLFPEINSMDVRLVAEEKPEVFVMANFISTDASVAGYSEDLAFLDRHYKVVWQMSYRNTAIVAQQVNETHITVYEKMRK